MYLFGETHSFAPDFPDGSNLPQVLPLQWSKNSEALLDVARQGAFNWVDTEPKGSRSYDSASKEVPNQGQFDFADIALWSRTAHRDVEALANGLSPEQVFELYLSAVSVRGLQTSCCHDQAPALS